LIGSEFGIHAKWISAVSNKTAKKISRIKKSNTTLSFHYDFSKLQQDNVVSKHCHFFQPSPELLSSTICNIFSDSKIARLKQGSGIETGQLGQA
jgi:hypothetical protein